MIKYFLLLFLTFSAFAVAFAQTQTNFSIGFGLYHSFFVDKQEQFYENYNNLSPHFSFQMDISEQKKMGFTGIIQVNLLQKKIAYGFDYILATGRKVEEGFSHQIFSAELVLAAGFNFPLKRSIIQPKLGFCFAFNQYIGISEYTKLSSRLNVGGNQISQGSQVSSWIFNPNETEPFFVYPTILIGGELKRKFFKQQRKFSFFLDAYLSPSNIFTSPFTYDVNGDNFELQGKYHYMNLGLRININKIKQL